MQLMSAAPAAVSIASLRIEKSPSDAAAASAAISKIATNQANTNQEKADKIALGKHG